VPRGRLRHAMRAASRPAFDCMNTVLSGEDSSRKIRPIVASSTTYSVAPRMHVSSATTRSRSSMVTGPREDSAACARARVWDTFWSAIGHRCTLLRCGPITAGSFAIDALPRLSGLTPTCGVRAL